MLLVGAAKRTITPTVRGQPVFLAGDEPGRQARSVLDDLWARALALRCGGTTVVLVALDLLGLPYRHVREARQQVTALGLPGEQVVVTCTRNHAGPDVSGQWQGGGWLRRAHRPYVRFLCAELAAIVRQAVADLQPAQAYLARQQISDVVGGASLRELAVAQFRALDGSTIATLVNYPLVPQVLGPHSDAVSADFPHALYQALEGPDLRGPVTLYACAAAREEPAPAFRARTAEEAARVGGALAAAVEAALGGPPVPVERLHLWRAPVAASAARHGLRVAGRGGTIESEVALLELGPARMALLPGLIAPQVGMEVRRMLDAPYRFVVGPANDDLGYIEAQDDARTAPAASSLLSTLLLDALDRLLLEAYGAGQR
ncbi:MAG TPA: hypothetical protein VM366_14240 [Anaerolineae bacterium]|nr:hypothetical protein [Anaerolineae bacterium]